MFGFVTFSLPETVRLILEKVNPHFVCDSRVLVKPYKEKGKIVEKKQQQHQQQQYSDRGDFAACLSPSGIDSNKLGNLPIGPRMLHNTQEMMRREKMEQEMELQHAIELPRPKDDESTDKGPWKSATPANHVGWWHPNSLSNAVSVAYKSENCISGCFGEVSSLNFALNSYSLQTSKHTTNSY